MSYGFKNTKCKIDNCNNLVWPNKELGYCNRHYQRFHTGRMDAVTGELATEIKEKICESCGDAFLLNNKARNVRWCPNCRPKEYSKIQTDNNHGIFRTKGRREKQYIIKCLDVISNSIERYNKVIERNTPILNARKEWLSFRNIGKKFHISGQRAQQICVNYLTGQ